MTHRILSWAFVVLIVAGPLGSAQNLKSQRGSAKSNHHTNVTLIANVKSIQPGVPFTIGARMKMENGWHTYWKNPGEAGLPTEISWSLPQGFSAGEIQWPLPHKYNESGDVLTYGYEDENLLLVEIKPPATMAPGTAVTLKAEITWLECEKLCLPGDASVELQLPVFASVPEVDNQSLFEKYRAKIPSPHNNLDFQLNAVALNGKVTLNLNSAGKRFGLSNGLPDFYPEPLDPIMMSRTEVKGDDAAPSLAVNLSADEKIGGSKTLKGVIVYQLEGEAKKAVAVEIPLSKDFLDALASGSASETSQGGGLLDQNFKAIETAQSQQPLYMYVVFAIIGGLLLNIMPCVLPVIALKIFGLVRMAANEPRQIRTLGWFFSLGILASFIAIALVVLVLKSAGESVGWGFQFQEPLFVIAMSAVVFAFGLSLFGVFEIAVPSFAVSGVSSVTAKTDSSKHGYAASFAEGVFATILATPCTAPFLGSAMGFAFSQPAYIVLILFAAVAFGMALPYLILTAKPAWMKYLPKPGEWMVSAKQFMGFLMMGTMLWLLQILGSQLGMEAVIWTGAFLLLVGIACWMIGRFATLTATRSRYFATWGAALILVIAGYMFFIGDILKARDVLTSTAQAETTANAGSTENIVWQPFTLEQLETNLRDKKTVFLDFTAEWCLTCKVNEKTVLADQSVIDALKQKGIVTMKADWTTRNETITKLLAKFGRSGVPLYVVFPKDRPTEPIVLPEVITTGIVLDALEKAG